MALQSVPIAHSLAGGALIGAGAAMLRLSSGGIAGISGVFSSVLRADVGASYWRVFFLVGLLLPALIVPIRSVEWQIAQMGLLFSGLLVGFGTRIGSGCTSGHGVCGLANVSVRSLAATATFMTVAMLVVLVRHRLES